MKKIYREPRIKVVRMSYHQMLCSSPEQIDITDGEEGALHPIE